MIGLPREESRGRLENLALLLKAAVLTPQPVQLLALIAGQPVAALTAVKRSLLHPVAQRLRRDPELVGICGIDEPLERTNSTA